MESDPSEPTAQPGLALSSGVVLASAGIVSAGLLLSGGQLPVPILLAIAAIVPGLVSWGTGTRWPDLEAGLLHGMQLALSAVAILLVVGAAIAAWAASGTLSAMVDLGLTLLHPAVFLPATVVVCGAVSLAIGSSWATAATVGVALMGVGTAFGQSPPVIAGAVLSGAYFGDKMSPLSDTTNLAPGVTGVPLFTHIQAMVTTTVPALILALIGFTLLGAIGGAGDFDPSSIEELRRALGDAQIVHPLALLPPVVVVGLASLRVPALPALVAGTAVGLALAVGLQGEALQPMLTALYSGYTTDSTVPAVGELLSRGGMASMLDTVALILCATALGGLLERGGFIRALLVALLRRVHSDAGLVTATVVSAIGINVFVAEQYLAIVLPGRLFGSAYAERGLSPALLSRSLEDAGTVTSPLVPWNSCGAYMAATLGVSTLSYAPYALFNLAMPLVALSFAWLGIAVLKGPLVKPLDLLPDP